MLIGLIKDHCDIAHVKKSIVSDKFELLHFTVAYVNPRLGAVTIFTRDRYAAGFSY